MQSATQKDKTKQAILKELSQEDIEEFTKNNKFLLF